MPIKDKRKHITTPEPLQVPPTPLNEFITNSMNKLASDHVLFREVLIGGIIPDELFSEIILALQAFYFKDADGIELQQAQIRWRNVLGGELRKRITHEWETLNGKQQEQ